MKFKRLAATLAAAGLLASVGLTAPGQAARYKAAPKPEARYQVAPAAASAQVQTAQQVPWASSRKINSPFSDSYLATTARWYGRGKGLWIPRGSATTKSVKSVRIPCGGQGMILEYRVVADWKIVEGWHDLHTVDDAENWYSNSNANRRAKTLFETSCYWADKTGGGGGLSWAVKWDRATRHDAYKKKGKKFKRTTRVFKYSSYSPGIDSAPRR